MSTNTDIEAYNVPTRCPISCIGEIWAMHAGMSEMTTPTRKP